MLIVGFGHKARRGKNTATQAIIEARSELKNLDIRSYGFGDALKKEVNEAAVSCGGMFALFQALIFEGAPLPNGRLLKLPSNVKFDPDAPMDDPLCPLGKQRQLLQWWGSEYRRAHDKFYWVKGLRETLMQEQPQVALIYDVRFKNEFFWVKANGGFTVQLERTGFVDLATSPDHHSEHELDGAPYDITITVADGDVEQLKLDAVEVFDMIVNTVTQQALPKVEEIPAPEPEPDPPATELPLAA